jgi:hypothetical protein
VANDQQCGRAVHLDAHIRPLPTVVAGDDGPRIPEECGRKLNTGEEALAFLFFDLAACVQNDTIPVAPPIIVP